VTPVRFDSAFRATGSAAIEDITEYDTGEADFRLLLEKTYKKTTWEGVRPPRDGQMRAKPEGQKRNELPLCGDGSQGCVVAESSAFAQSSIQYRNVCARRRRLASQATSGSRTRAIGRNHQCRRRKYVRWRRRLQSSAAASPPRAKAPTMTSR